MTPTMTETDTMQSILEQREKWGDERSAFDGLGASDIATVVGVSPYKSALQLWLEMTGRDEKPDYEHERLLWGTALEPIIIREKAMRDEVFIVGRDEFFQPALFAPSGKVWGKDSGVFLQHNLDEVVQLLDLSHPGHPWLVAHPDGYVLDVNGKPVELLQIKTSSQYRKREWGDEDTDQVPDEYIVQEQIEMMLYRIQVGLTRIHEIPARVGVLIGGQSYREFVVEPHKELQENLVKIAVEFMRQVDKNDEDDAPDPKNAAEHVNALKKIYPLTTGEERVATGGEDSYAHALRLAQLDLEAATSRVNQAKAHLMKSMGDVYKLAGSGWSATFYEKKGAPKWKEIAETIWRDLGEQVGDSEKPIPGGMIDEHRGKPSRVFSARVSDLTPTEEE
jgi:predicted phage-related endonuclease